MSKHFFLIGAQRSGTTYLYHVLNEHPMIEMATPVKPEPKFFLQSLNGLTKGDYLRRHFNGKTHATLLGEKSTSYMESEHAAKGIAQWYPDARIVMILREPVARAISNYQFSAENGVESLPFEKAVLQEEERRENYDKDRFSTSPYAYLKRGRYMDDIEMWLRHFPREQILTLIHEEVIGELKQVQQLYGELGVDANYQPKILGEIVNGSEKRSSVSSLSAGAQEYVKNYFAESTASLEAFLGRAIPRWV